MANRSKGIGTAFETSALRNCLSRVWPKMERTGSKVAFGQLPDFDDKEENCPIAWEAKASPQQRFAKWWEQATNSARKVRLLPSILWRRKGFPRAPFVVFDWPAFEPIALFLRDYRDAFEPYLQAYLQMQEEATSSDTGK